MRKSWNIYRVAEGICVYIAKGNEQNVLVKWVLSVLLFLNYVKKATNLFFGLCRKKVLPSPYSAVPIERAFALGFRNRKIRN